MWLLWDFTIPGGPQPLRVRKKRRKKHTKNWGFWIQFLALIDLFPCHSIYLFIKSFIHLFLEGKYLKQPLPDRCYLYCFFFFPFHNPGGRSVNWNWFIKNCRAITGLLEITEQLGSFQQKELIDFSKCRRKEKKKICISPRQTEIWRNSRLHSMPWKEEFPFQKQWRNPEDQYILFNYAQYIDKPMCKRNKINDNYIRKGRSDFFWCSLPQTVYHAQRHKI